MVKVTKTFIFLILNPILVLSQSLQPSVIATDGGFFISTQGSISWTLGEPISETYTSINNYLTQGFQQPRSIIVSTGGGIGFVGLTVYPNPVSTELFVDVHKLEATDYTIKLYDAQGREVFNKSFFCHTIISIPLLSFSNGIYVLSVSSSHLSQSFKIVKTK